MLIVKPRMGNIFKASSPISFKNVFKVSILRSTPYSTPLKYRCPNFGGVGITQVYLILFLKKRVLIEVLPIIQATRRFNDSDIRFVGWHERAWSKAVCWNCASCSTRSCSASSSTLSVQYMTQHQHNFTSFGIWCEPHYWDYFHTKNIGG